MDFEADCDEIIPDDANHDELFGGSHMGLTTVHRNKQIEEAMVTSQNVTSEPLVLSPDVEIPKVSIKNYMTTVDLRTQIDLRLATISLRNVEYCPRKMCAAVLRLQKPPITANIFPGGKVSICGAKSIQQSREGAKIVAKLLKKTGHSNVKFCNFKVESLVCNADCGFNIRLENLAQDHAPYCSYEPEVFCGLVYRYRPTPNNKASILVFVSGKVIINGTKSLEQAEEVFRNMYALLYQYRGVVEESFGGDPLKAIAQAINPAAFED